MSALVFVDTETTGLDPAVQCAYEVAWAVEDGDVQRLVLPHTLDNADPKALEIGGYFTRGIDQERPATWGEVDRLREALAGATMVGSNPAFDAGMLRNVVGPVWSHRLVNVAEGGMWAFGWDRPRGLAAVTAELRDRGYTIPQPDHTAVADVEATRAVYNALRSLVRQRTA